MNATIERTNPHYSIQKREAGSRKWTEVEQLPMLDALEKGRTLAMKDMTGARYRLRPVSMNQPTT